MFVNDKHFSLLPYGINYGSKMFYDTCPKTLEKNHSRAFTVKYFLQL
jgi:hypothetical protein